jgi:hypothetical protein
MINNNGFPDLFPYAQHKFAELVNEFAAYGLEVERSMELKRGTGFLCHYDQRSGHIYLALPEPTHPLGKAQIFFLKALLNLPDDETLFRFISLLLPRALAHEFGHYFRHKYGTLTEDRWYEEQVANHLANAVTKYRLNPQEKDSIAMLLRQTIDHLSQQMRSRDIAFDSYDSQIHALYVAGSLTAADADTILTMNKILSLEPEKLLEQLGHVVHDISERMLQREMTIDGFNKEYTSDVLKYLYYQLGWMLVDTESREHHYVDEFAGRHLNRQKELLRLFERDDLPSEDEILACYKAYRDTAPLSTTASRYFYKRYRSLLLSRLRNEVKDLQGNPLSTREAQTLLETWEEQNLDPLNLIMPLVPQGLQHLLPVRVANELKLIPDPGPYFHAETDGAIWRHVALRIHNPRVQDTLSRLQSLDQINMYRSLPVAILMDIIRELWIIKVMQDETLIWEKSLNDDIFILIDGRLGVFTSVNHKSKRVGTIHPGEMFGEMAFVSRKPRAATIRAIEYSECFVLKSSDLRALALRHPIILFEVAKSLTEKLDILNEKSEVLQP